MQIIPSKELKDTNCFSERCHTADMPVFITINGYGDMVIMSMELFESSRKRRENYSEIELSEKQIKEKKTKDARTALGDLRKKYVL